MCGHECEGGLVFRDARKRVGEVVQAGRWNSGHLKLLNNRYHKVCIRESAHLVENYLVSEEESHCEKM